MHVHRALRLARRARRVVHHGADLPAWCGRSRTSSGASAISSFHESSPGSSCGSLPCSTMMMCFSSGQVGLHRRDLRALLRRRHEHLRAGIRQAVARRVRAERREQRARHAARLQRAEDGGVQLRHAVHEAEDAVALRDAQLPEHVGELVRHAARLRRRCTAPVRRPCPPRSQQSFVAVPVDDVPVDRLVGDVQPPPGQAIELVDDVRVVEGRADRRRSRRGWGARGTGSTGGFGDGRVVHRGTSFCVRRDGRVPQSQSHGSGGGQRRVGVLRFCRQRDGLSH